MDSDQLKARGAGPDGAEEDPGQRRPRSGAAAHQRHGDAVEAVAGAEDTRILVLGAEDEQPAGEARQRAGERHRLADAPAGGDAGRARRFLAGTDGAPFESAAGAGEQEPDAGGDDQREGESDVEPALRKEARQPGGALDRLGSSDADRGAAARRRQRARHQPAVHEMDGDPVEQDGADHLVHAAAHLEHAGEEAPHGAGRGRGAEAERPGANAACDRRRQAAPDELSFGADVEEADGEGDRDAQAGENQHRGLDGGLAEGTRSAERAGDEVAEARQRIAARRGDGEEGENERDRHGGDGRPEWIARRGEDFRAQLRHLAAPTSCGRDARRWPRAAHRPWRGPRRGRGCGGRRSAARRDRGR